jgi:hypothetical protein
MIDRRSARRRLPGRPAAHLAAEAASTSADTQPVVRHPGGPTDLRHAGRRACLRAMVKVAATASWLWPRWRRRRGRRLTLAGHRLHQDLAGSDGSPTPAEGGGRSSTGSCTCPRRGPRIGPAAGPPASPSRSGSGPSHSWPGSCSSAPWTLGSRPAGSPPTRPTAATRRSGASWRIAACPMCWPSSAAARIRVGLLRGGLTRSEAGRVPCT